jgi:hypothetical protein
VEYYLQLLLCSGCLRQETGNHTWGAWGSWTAVSLSQHRQVRSCTTRAVAGEQFGDHNRDYIVYAGNSSDSGHHHTLSCSLCGRHIATNRCVFSRATGRGVAGAHEARSTNGGCNFLSSVNEVNLLSLFKGRR